MEINFEFYKQAQEAARLEAELKKRRRRRRLAITLSFVVVFAALAGAVAFVYFDLFHGMGNQVIPQNRDGFNVAHFGEDEYDPTFESLYDITDAANLNDFLRQWWYNSGDDVIMYNRDVLNILLLGVDHEEHNEGFIRSNTMMLVSINQRTRMITLLSFLRDSYTYLNIEERQMFHRLNSAYAMGGAEGVREAIQRLYKIRVDNYVAICMRSFPRLIDALGGVRVDVTQAEANFINRTAPSMQWSFPQGEQVLLNGRQALVFTRIRRLDSDMARTNRQQLVVQSLIRSARGASVRQLYSALDAALPFVYTDFTRGELIRRTPAAMGWLNFGMTMMHIPVVYGENESAFPGTVNGMYVFITDFPLAAQKVQLALYGETNITLDEERGDYVARLFQGRRPWSDTPAQTTQPPQEAPAEWWVDDEGNIVFHTTEPWHEEPYTTERPPGIGDILDGIFGNRPGQEEPPEEETQLPPEVEQPPEEPPGGHEEE